MLRPVGHEDVLGVAGHGPRDADVAADGLPQSGKAGRIPIAARRVRASPQLRGHQSSPRVEREQPRVGDADAEVVGQHTVRRHRGGGRRPAPTGSNGTRPPAPSRTRVRHVVGHVGAGADARDEEALGDEPLVCGGDGTARQFEPAGELAGRREAVAGPQPSVTDRLPQLSVEPRGEVPAAGETQMELHVRARRGAGPGGRRTGPRGIRPVALDPPRPRGAGRRTPARPPAAAAAPPRGPVNRPAASHAGPVGVPTASRRRWPVDPVRDQGGSLGRRPGRVETAALRDDDAEGGALRDRRLDPAVPKHRRSLAGGLVRLGEPAVLPGGQQGLGQDQQRVGGGLRAGRLDGGVRRQGPGVRERRFGRLAVLEHPDAEPQRRVEGDEAGADLLPGPPRVLELRGPRPSGSLQSWSARGSSGWWRFPPRRRGSGTARSPARTSAPPRQRSSAGE